MEAMYGLTAKKNSEIRFRWQMLGVASGYEVIYPHVVEFLTSQARPSRASQIDWSAEPASFLVDLKNETSQSEKSIS